MLQVEVTQAVKFIVVISSFPLQQDVDGFIELC